jgi:hypothetical protein
VLSGKKTSDLGLVAQAQGEVNRFSDFHAVIQENAFGLHTLFARHLSQCPKSRSDHIPKKHYLKNPSHWMVPYFWYNASP